MLSYWVCVLMKDGSATPLNVTTLKHYGRDDSCFRRFDFSRTIMTRFVFTAVLVS